MKFKAEIDVMPLEALLDPQGKAVLGGLQNLNIKMRQCLRNKTSIRLTKDLK